MKKSISVIIALFIISSVFSQIKKGIIYEYKKNQAIVALGTSSNAEIGYFRRVTKNLSFGVSVGVCKTNFEIYSWSDSASYYDYMSTNIVPVFLDIKYNFFVKKRIQPSILLSTGYDIEWEESVSRFGIGIDYHFKSDNHVITLMSNNLSLGYAFNNVNNVTLRYSYKF